VGNQGGTHIFVQLADPQLGMLNQFAPGDMKNNFELEASMAGQLAHMASLIDPKPTFFFLGGDMQNQWPHNDAEEGEIERNAVEDFLAPVKAAKIPIVCTPGNHDVDDDPSTQDLNNYEKWWNRTCYAENKLSAYGYEKDPNGIAEKWILDNILFLQMDSQLYYTTNHDVQTARDLQTQWLESAVTDIDSIKLIVVLTHIPPFMNEPREPHGWANWDNTADNRISLLDRLHYKNKPIPVMWVCGHFHTNVFNANHAVHKLRVTSAAGTTMWWNKSKGEMTPEQAAVVAGMPVNQAFCEYITKLKLDGKKCSGFDFAAKTARMRPDPDRSGMRIFVFQSDSGHSIDKWFTLSQLNSMLAANVGTEKEGKLALLKEAGF